MALYSCTLCILAFHDLTHGKSVAPAAASILGLGLKFVPTPEKTTSRKTATVASDRFKRDLGWKILYASNAADKKVLEKTKLYLRSSRPPPLPPRNVDNRISRFQRSLLAFFSVYKKGKPNLTPFQRSTLEQLLGDNSKVFALADKI